MTETAPAIGFSIAIQLDEKHGITAQTHVDQTASLTSINEILDKVQAAIERQATKSKLVGWREKLKYDEKKLAQLKEDFASIDQRHKAEWERGGKRGSFKLGVKEEAERRNALSTIDRYELEIGLDKENIVECEAKLAKEPLSLVA